jgi:hypothetical protein
VAWGREKGSANGCAAMLDISECFARTEWARKRFAELRAEAKQFIDGQPYEFTMAYDADAGVLAARLHPEQVPLEISFMVGEIMHNLRSALDHLVWQMTIANGHVPPPFPLPRGSQWRDIQFPIAMTSAQFDNPSRDPLWGISDRHRAFLREYQPFYGELLGEGLATDSALYALQEFSNIDKHRVPHLTTQWIQFISVKLSIVEDCQVGVKEAYSASFPGPIDADAEIARIGFDPKPSLAPRFEGEIELGLVFHETSGLGTNKLVIPTIDMLGNQVAVLFKELLDLESPAGST